MLAALLAKTQRPGLDLWGERVVSSRLLEYEAWIRLDALQKRTRHGAGLEALLTRVQFWELSRDVLARALQPLPRPVRALDALHVATAVFIRSEVEPVQVASYDTRLRAAAEAEGLPLYPL